MSNDNIAEPESLYSHFRGVSVEQVIKVIVNEGDGVIGDPVIQVTYWYTMDGNLIGHNDTSIRQFVPRTKEEQTK